MQKKQLDILFDQRAIRCSPTNDHMNDRIRSGTGDNNVPQIITESTSIDYDIHGEGPPLILINGLGFG